MTALGRVCGSGLVMTDGGGASAVGAAAGAALSRSDALSPVADATVAASLVGDGSKTQRIGVCQYSWEVWSRSNRAVPRFRRLLSFSATAQNGGGRGDCSNLTLRTAETLRKQRLETPRDATDILGIVLRR